MDIILKGREAEEYILSRQMCKLKNHVDELKKMHDGLRHCNRFELSDLCNKIDTILSEIQSSHTLYELARLSVTP